MENEIWNDGKNQLTMKFLSKVEGYQYCFIKVISGIFIGGAEFCIPIEDLNNFALLENSEYVTGNEVIISDYDSDSYVKFTPDGVLGKFLITGQVGGTHRANNLRFEFQADQTILQKVIDAIKQL